jgi:hypothetical protein
LDAQQTTSLTLNIFSPPVTKEWPHPTATVGQILNAIVTQHRDKLVAALARVGRTRVLVIELDSSKVSGTEVKWVEDLREVIETAASNTNLKSNDSFQKFTSRANRLATGYLVAMSRLSESITKFITFKTDDINDDVREKAEKDLREAIGEDFPLPERPKLTGLDALNQGEEECEVRHRAAVERFEQLLHDLEGFEGPSKQVRQEVTKRVAKLAHRLGLVLVSQDQTGELVPVTLRCRGQKYEVRGSVGNQVGSYDAFPALQVVSRESLTSNSNR